MKTAIVVQARMSSRRMPGQALALLAGSPAILRVMERVRRVRNADRVVVVTSTHASDDPVVKLLEEHDIPSVRGSEESVLDRFISAVPEDCAAVVRLTSDCPLIDPALIALHIDRFLAEQPDTEYVSNTLVRTYPDGLEVEVFSREILLRAREETPSEFDREHVTPWIQRNARALPITQEVDLSALRWTLDTRADHAFLSRIFEALSPERAAFTTKDVYRLLLARPELIRIAGKEELDPRMRREWMARIQEHLESLQLVS